jgi:hypothetical protein
MNIMASPLSGEETPKTRKNKNQCDIKYMYRPVRLYTAFILYSDMHGALVLSVYFVEAVGTRHVRTNRISVLEIFENFA